MSALTLFDYVALAILALSGLVGFFRGAAREMITVLAFLAAAALAIFGLRFTGPMARQTIDPDWAANVGAVLFVFVIAYVILRLIGSALARRIQTAQVIGTLDRSIGLGFGLVRALAVLGAFNLLFNAATPPERVPRWISGAVLYPLTTSAAQVLKAFAPKGLVMAGRFKPALDDALRDGARDSAHGQSYDARERGGIDDLVEKSR